MRYFLLNKPRGCITSTIDDAGRGRPTVYEVAEAAGIPSFGPVGRLDYDTSGVLIFTDDFKLKKAISSPSFKGKAEVGTVPSMEKVYHALIAGTVDPDDKEVHKMREPLHYYRKMDGPGGCWTKPAEVRILKTKGFKKGEPVPWRFKPGTTATITWMEVVLREGKNRQIRRLCRRSDFELTRLHRVSVGPILLGDLKEGSSRELTRTEVEALYKRCLPLDPLCPTVHQIRLILRYCILRAKRRTCAETSSLQPPLVECCNNIVQEDEGTAKANPGQGAQNLGAALSCGLADSPGRGERLGRAVRHILDFAKRDLHQTIEGPDEDYDAPEFCAEEGESLTRARAVPPNEDHMLCGYRTSQIERGE